MLLACPLDAFSLCGAFAVVLAGILLSVETGHRLGGWRLRVRTAEKEAPVGGMVAAELGLLAFILAFIFGMGGSRAEARRDVLLEDSNAIGTTFLRAAMLPAEERASVRKLLREYTDVRLAAVEQGSIENGIRRSGEIQDLLWHEAVVAAEKDPRSVPIGLFIDALNGMIDVHAKRLALAVRNRIPSPIWIVLFCISALSFSMMGYHSGLTGASRSPATLAIAVTFAAVIWLVADLDRPQEGFLKTSQQPMIELREMMTATKD